jgi:hypothetical protein
MEKDGLDIVYEKELQRIDSRIREIHQTFPPEKRIGKIARVLEILYERQRFYGRKNDDNTRGDIEGSRDSRSDGR